MEKRSKSIGKKCGICLMVLAFVLVVSAAAVVIFVSNQENSKKTQAQKENTKSPLEYRVEKFALGEGVFYLDVADNPVKRTLGLSGREELGENRGMIFIFEKEGKHGFWMKDMKFSLDIIWLDKDLEVVDIKTDASPKSFPEIFFPKEEALYVVELKSGSVGKYNIKIGEKASFVE